jgi:hypothetical protein
MRHPCGAPRRSLKRSSGFAPVPLLPQSFAGGSKRIANGSKNYRKHQKK